MIKLYCIETGLWSAKCEVREVEIEKETPKTYKVKSGIYRSFINKEELNKNLSSGNIQVVTDNLEEGFKVVKEEINKKVEKLEEKLKFSKELYLKVVEKEKENIGE